MLALQVALAVTRSPANAWPAGGAGTGALLSGSASVKLKPVMAGACEQGPAWKVATRAEEKPPESVTTSRTP